MKTHLIVPSYRSADVSFLRNKQQSDIFDHVHISAGAGAAPPLENLSTFILHRNCPDEFLADEKIKWLVNMIHFPMRMAISDEVADEDRVWILQEDTELTPKLRGSFAAVADFGHNVVCLPPFNLGDGVKEYHARALLMRGDAYKKYHGVLIPKDERVTRTSVEYIMARMQEDGQSIQFTSP